MHSQQINAFLRPFSESLISVFPKRLIETSQFGDDSAAIEQQINKQKKFHSSIQRSVEVDRARDELMQKGDKGAIHALDQEWDSLQKMSMDRMDQLRNLKNIIEEISREIMWVNEREEEELVFDWGDKNIDLYIPKKQESYSKLMSELEGKEKDLNKLKQKVDGLLKNNHPASDKIEAYMETLQTQWSWLLQITKCIHVHLKENAAYSQFFKEANETYIKLQKQNDTIRKKYTCDKSTPLESLMDLINNLEKDKERILENKRQVQSLVSKSKSIVRLKPRNPEEKTSGQVIVKALTDFKQDQKVIFKDNEGILKDNSQRSKWQVTGPGGLDMMIPSVCLQIPPPNPISINLAEKNDQFYEAIMSVWSQLYINMKSLISWQYCMKDIGRINSLTITMLAKMRPEEYQSIIKSLEMHYQEFQRNSHGSEVIGDEDKRRIATQYSGAQTYYTKLIIDLPQHQAGATDGTIASTVIPGVSAAPPDKPEGGSRSQTLLIELLNLRQKLEQCESGMTQHIHIPMQEDSVKDCSIRINHLETIHRDVDGIHDEYIKLRERILRELQGMKDPDKVRFLETELTLINQKIGNLKGFSSAYLQRLNSLRNLLQSILQAEDIIKVHEARLTEKETTSLDFDEVEDYRGILKKMKSDLEQKKDLLNSMDTELSNAVHWNNQISQSFHKCDVDLSKYTDTVGQMSDRWRRIQTQIDSRQLWDLDKQLQQLKHYRQNSTQLSRWITETKQRQDALQSSKFEDTKVLMEFLNQQKMLHAEIKGKRDKVEDNQKNAEICSHSVKDYELQLASYSSGLETLLNIPIKKTVVQSPSTTILQESAEVQSNYIELLTRSGDYYKFLGEMLKNMEELKVWMLWSLNKILPTVSPISQLHAETVVLFVFVRAKIRIRKIWIIEPNQYFIYFVPIFHFTVLFDMDRFSEALKEQHDLKFPSYSLILNVLLSYNIYFLHVCMRLAFLLFLNMARSNCRSIHVYLMFSRTNDWVFKKIFSLGVNVLKSSCCCVVKNLEGSKTANKVQMCEMSTSTSPTLKSNTLYNSMFALFKSISILMLKVNTALYSKLNIVSFNLYKSILKQMYYFKGKYEDELSRLKITLESEIRLKQRLQDENLQIGKDFNYWKTQYEMKDALVRESDSEKNRLERERNSLKAEIDRLAAELKMMEERYKNRLQSSERDVSEETQTDQDVVTVDASKLVFADENVSYVYLKNTCRTEPHTGLLLLPAPEPEETVPGLREPVPIKNLVDAGLLAQSDITKLHSGAMTTHDIEEKLKLYLHGSSCIAGIYDEANDRKLSFHQAMKEGLLRRGTTLELLEAQAASGFIVDPVNNLMLTVEEADKRGLIDKDFKHKLLSAERAVTGYKDPATGKIISLFQAIEKEIIEKGHGIRLLEAQIASGGIIDPKGSHRIDVDVAYKRGYFDQEMNDILSYAGDDTKGFFDPNTEENLTYLDLKKRCIPDKETGLVLLPLIDKKKQQQTTQKNTLRKRRVVIVDPDTEKEMTVREAFHKNLIDYDTFIELSEQECEWEEITTTASDGSSRLVIVDRKTGQQFDIQELLDRGVIDKITFEKYRSGSMTLTQFADIITNKTIGELSSSSSSLEFRSMSPTLLSPGSPSVSRKRVASVSITLTPPADQLDENSAIAAIFDTETIEKITISEAVRRGVLDSITGQRLLEAQACTGGIINPSTGFRLLLQDAVTQGIIDEDMATRLKPAQKAYVGFEDMKTKTKMSAAQAIKEKWLPYEAGQRFLEYQYVTGGLIEPGVRERITIQEAIKKGWLDGRAAQKLQDTRSYSRSLTCPKTKLKVSYKEAMDSSMVEENSGMKLLQASSVSSKGISSPYNVSSASGSRSGSRTGSRSGSRRGSVDYSSNVTYSSYSSYTSSSVS
ncbi:DESP protein, partial [Amia calva]|nr:DESP protein [Amia calva]